MQLKIHQLIGTNTLSDKHTVKKIKILKELSLYTGSTVLEKSIGFLMLPVVTRYLAVDEYGYYSLYISVVTFLSIFIGFGGDNYARLLTVKSPELYSRS